MGLLSLILGWNYRVRRLRKRWDRLREKSLKKHGIIRGEALKRLDLIENNIRTLEEQRLNRIVRVRMAKETEIGLAEVKALLKSSEDEFREYKASQRSPQK
jgi:hypothetical protein